MEMEVDSTTNEIVKILHAMKLKRKGQDKSTSENSLDDYSTCLKSDNNKCNTPVKKKKSLENKKPISNQHVCQQCQKKFSMKKNLLKHMEQYPNEHKLLKCCKKVINIIEVDGHDCHKRDISDSCLKEKKLHRNVKNGESKGNKNERSDIQVQEKENSNAKVDITKLLSKKANIYDIDTESDDTVPDVFDSIFKKQRRKRNKQKKAEDTSENKKSDSEKPLDDQSSVNCVQKVHMKKGKFRCSTCDEMFDSSSIYKNHVDLHGPEDRVVCKGCKKVFESLRLYYIHAKQYPGKHCYLCKHCLRKFPSELLLEQHVCVCVNGKPFICGCGQEFTKYIDVITHSKGTKPFNCCSCSHKSLSLTAHLRHMRKHSKQKPFVCQFCSSSFAVIDFLNIHMNKVHKHDARSENPPSENIVLSTDSEVFNCTPCNSMFSTEEEYKKHVETHNERVPCPDCGKSLKRIRLESHRNTHKTSASLCPECGKLFDTRFKLTQHVITTHNAEPVQCQVCEKVLKTKKIFNEHMKTHMKSELGERIPQAICPVCGLGLAQKGSLARHILLMHEKHKLVNVDVPHKCEECGEICPNKGKYYSHRRKHRAMVDKFPCALCGRVFNKKQNLRRHMYLLHDERRIIEDPIYECQVCTRSFREKKNLRRHYRMVHKLDDIL